MPSHRCKIEDNHYLGGSKNNKFETQGRLSINKVTLKVFVVDLGGNLTLRGVVPWLADAAVSGKS